MKPNIAIKILLLSLSSLLLIGTFQNCAQASGPAAFIPSTSGSLSETENSDSLEKIDNIDLSSADYITVSLRSLYSEASQRPSARENQNLQINLLNGEMIAVDSEGGPLSSTRLCLKYQELEEFKAVLKMAKLCQPAISNLREDVVCTQVYKSPFAYLQYANGDKVKLGEVSGCSRSLDICDEYREAYNGFIAYIRNNLERSLCL